MRIAVILLILFLFPLSKGKAQNVFVSRDLKARSSVGLNYDINDKFAAFSEFETEFQRNISQFGKAFVEAGANYSPFDLLKLEAKYRFTKNRKKYGENFKYTHTVALSAEARQKVDRFKLYYRLQVQNRDEDVLDEGWNGAENVLKNRFKIKYNIKGVKINPYAYTELYTFASGFSNKKLKTIVGVEWELKKQLELKTYFRNDRELNTVYPYSFYTLGIKLDFSL